MGMFLNDDDAIAALIHDRFQRDLGRSPSETDVESWKAIQQASGGQAVIYGIWGSAEACARRAAIVGREEKLDAFLAKQ